jgi:uncharacterized membrane protein
MTGRRMEAFSDGVIAILITIMVLELHKPSGPSFADLRATYPSLLAYVLSFVNLGIYWNNHHHLLMTVRRVTGAMLWANLSLLFCLSLFPFATAWMAENGFSSDSIAAYGVVTALASFAFLILEKTIVRTHGNDVRLKKALGRNIKEKFSTVGFIVSIPLALVFRWASIGLFIVIALVWFIPDRRLQNYVESTATESDESRGFPA